MHCCRGNNVTNEGTMSESTISRTKRGPASSAVNGFGATATIPERQHKSNLPLSFAQERLWFLAPNEGSSRAYQTLRGLRLLGALDETALRVALNQIVSRHEALRTVFTSVEGKAVQQIIDKKD